MDGGPAKGAPNKRRAGSGAGPLGRVSNVSKSESAPYCWGVLPTCYCARTSTKHKREAKIQTNDANTHSQAHTQNIIGEIRGRISLAAGFWNKLRTPVRLNSYHCSLLASRIYDRESPDFSTRAIRFFGDAGFGARSKTSISSSCISSPAKSARTGGPITQHRPRTIETYTISVNWPALVFLNKLWVNAVEVQHGDVLCSHHMLEVHPTRSRAETTSLIETIYCGLDVTYIRYTRKSQYFATTTSYGT